MVLRNVAKTFSLEEQRQEINEIAVDLDAVNTTLTNWNASQWDTAYGWGDHALAGYLVATTTDKTNWNTAFGWGDHASAGYLTAYQTDAQIKTSYEANADTNAFTDAFQTKLNGIETGATADQAGAEIKTAYEGEADTNAFTDALQTKLNGIETGATADQTGAEIKTAYEGEADTNAFTDAEQTKLSGIEAGATVNAATGGTSGGIGTVADPLYGSVQFRGGTNTLLGDSVFVYDTTNNRLGINNGSPDETLHVSGNLEVNAYDNASGAGGYKTDLGLIIGNAYDAGITTLTDDRNAIIWQERALDLDIGTQNTFRVKLTYDGKIGIGVATPGATVHIRDSDNTTQGAAQLKISKGVGGGAVPETISRENLYLHLGCSEYGTNANGQYLIGFGYTNGETGTGIPAYIGFNEDDTAGYTNGSLVFGTRPNTLSDNVGRERMRITDKGVRQYPCANDASHAYQGIYQELSGKKQLTGSGNFTDIVEHGHSCNYRLQYYVLEDDNNSLGGGPGSADLFVRYGSGAYTNHVHSLSGMNGGSVSTPEIQYVNAGAKLQFRVTWSGSNPVYLYWHISGCGDRKIIAL